MSVTLSHQSALDVIRMLRCEGVSMHDMDVVPLAAPSPWVGKRLVMRNFNDDVWHWMKPSESRPLHISVPDEQVRVRSKGIVSHVANDDMPAGSVLWLDERSSVVCPELLFLQMADVFSVPALVMLGLELCGHFSRQAEEPLMGDVIDGLPAATTVKRLEKYLSDFKGTRGLKKARVALQYVCDHAASAPEAALATMFGLPPVEGGYGLGPVLLNERVELDDAGSWVRIKNRYPDLMFAFAPVGLNYDGFKHFDIADLMAAVDVFSRLEGEEQGKARDELKTKLVAVRAKVLDDNMRDRQLAAQGRIVFSVTKEDLADITHLDELARQVLSCANKVFGTDVEEHLEMLDDTSLIRERGELLSALAPHAGFGASSYGKL
ncbi:MAG: hypothetical protein Q4D48_09905 [Coriobacteriales bacterium]|nr:hypothetical protein [Coriobacteriales bacterium]